MHAAAPLSEPDRAASQGGGHASAVGGEGSEGIRGAAGVDASVLELAARRRLLRSLVQRGSSEIAGVVIPGVLCWFYSRSHASWKLWVWWAVFGVLMLGALLLRRSLQRDVNLPDALAVPKWERIFERVGFLIGLMWVVPIALTLHDSANDFKLFLYLVLCAIIASAATFIAPFSRLFWHFFLAIYVPMVAAVYWYLPQRWQYLLPLLLLYGVIIARHARGGRQMFVQQVEQERQRQELAERYWHAKEQAERALEEKNRFISATSHDLRQPLHALGLLVQAALQRNRDAALQPTLEDAQACVRSLAGMFNALMDLSRLEAGTFAARPEPVAVRAVCEDVVAVFAPVAALRGVRLRLRLPRHREAWAHTDPALLRQMLFNLVQNAVRYTHQGGVLLAVRARAGRWLVQVWDTGVGIALEDRSHVYTAYFRGAAPQVRASDGHGLGLAVVARSAMLVGADYGFESQPDRGSCFWLALPVHAPPGPVAQPVLHASASRPLAMSLSGTCLLVDDDVQVASALRRLLQSWGVVVHVAVSGAQAQALIAQGMVPDVVLCDQRLGACESGFAVLKRLLAACGHAHGAMVSAEHNAPELVQAEDEGYLVLRKPVEAQVLHALLARWMPAA